MQTDLLHSRRAFIAFAAQANPNALRGWEPSRGVWGA